MGEAQDAADRVCSGTVFVAGRLLCVYCLTSLQTALLPGRCTCRCYVCAQPRYAGCACTTKEYQCVALVAATNLRPKRYFFPKRADAQALMRRVVAEKRSYVWMHRRLQLYVRQKIKKA